MRVCVCAVCGGVRGADADGWNGNGADGGCEKADHDAGPVDQLAIKEAFLKDLKRQLQAASLYGGGFNAQGQAVVYRSSSKRPRDVLPEFWDLANNKQKNDIEAKRSAKGAELRDFIIPSGAGGAAPG